MIFAVRFLINLFRQKKGATGKKGTEILSNSLMVSALIVAAIIVLFLLIKSIMCRTGTWFGGAC